MINDFICPQCFIGRCQPGKGMYTALHEGSIVNIPDMPLHSCDVCNYRIFEDNLDQLITDLLAHKADESEETEILAKPLAGESRHIQNNQQAKRFK